jgi:hypothetical protein
MDLINHHARSSLLIVFHNVSPLLVYLMVAEGSSSTT